VEYGGGLGDGGGLGSKGGLGGGGEGGGGLGGGGEGGGGGLGGDGGGLGGGALSVDTVKVYVLVLNSMLNISLWPKLYGTHTYIRRKSPL
jgi:hypothetical protein